MTARPRPDLRCAEDLNNLARALVMMIDDEPLNLEVTQIHLEEAGYRNFVAASEPTEALALIVEKRPDVLLLDLMMPGITGFDILARMEAENILKDVPTIVLTSSTDSATKLKALELGATDFLAKPVDASELLLRLRNTLAAKAYRDRLANYDLLTGVPNRRTFMDRLEWALSNAERYGHSGAVLYVGLDEFKQVNEALGPGLGDVMLQRVAQRLENCLRTTDSVVRLDEGSRPSLSRLSGDEFTLMLPLIRKSEDAARVAQRVLGAVAAPFHLSDHELTVTCSVGIAVFPNDGLKADTIVKNAGAAMYHAKQRRKNTLEFYSKELNARTLQKLNLANELRKAIEREELRLYYQPKIDLRSGVVSGAEALLRWQHPKLGWVSPGEFITVAEESGLIIAIGDWVIDAACKQIAAWQRAGLRVPRIAINVSSDQFRDGRLTESVSSILTATGADSAHLGVELTEGVIMENVQSNIETLTRLKAMGIKLSIDDFGTGYSSLSYLNKFPLDELKIDRSFIAGIQSEDDRSPIITAIIAMAHGLGLIVVAEGVETERQLGFLRAQGCDEFQGYLKSKPLPTDEFTARFVEVR